MCVLTPDEYYSHIKVAEKLGDVYLKIEFLKQKNNSYHYRVWCIVVPHLIIK